MKAPEKVINGTWGELYIDDFYCADVVACQAKVALDKQEVNQTGTLFKGYKVVGIDGKGMLKFNKTTSFFINKMSDDMKNGKATVSTIITKLADPDADGVERVRLTGVTFDELTLADWEAKKNGEENVPFTFTGWDVMESIPS